MYNQLFCITSTSHITLNTCICESASKRDELKPLLCFINIRISTPNRKQPIQGHKWVNTAKKIRSWPLISIAQMGLATPSKSLVSNF